MSFPVRGGPAAVDLVNTEIVVRAKPQDLLASKDDLRRWLAWEQERGQLPPGDGRRQLELASFHELRRGLRQVLTAVAADEPPPEDAVARVNRTSRAGPFSLVLAADGALLEAVDEPVDANRASEPAAAVARSAVRFLASPDAGRLHACGNPACILFFVSENPRRQWCSIACGNRVRVLRHLRKS